MAVKMAARRAAMSGLSLAAQLAWKKAGVRDGTWAAVMAAWSEYHWAECWDCSRAVMTVHCWAV